MHTETSSLKTLKIMPRNPIKIVLISASENHFILIISRPPPPPLSEPVLGWDEKKNIAGRSLEHLDPLQVAAHIQNITFNWSYEGRTLHYIRQLKKIVFFVFFGLTFKPNTIKCAPSFVQVTSSDIKSRFLYMMGVNFFNYVSLWNHPKRNRK